MGHAGPVAFYFDTATGGRVARFNTRRDNAVRHWDAAVEGVARQVKLAEVLLGNNTSANFSCNGLARLSEDFRSESVGKLGLVTLLL